MDNLGPDLFPGSPNEHGIHSFETLIGKILIHEWGGSANFSAFETSLAREGVIKRNLTPAMLGDGQKVIIKNREILLKEFLVDA